MDYEKIGLKVGLEIHQQLEGKKLFCDCPTLMREDEPDIKLKRYLRASAGEGGKVDIAAQLEQLKKQHFLYEAYSDTTCLVELDEEPPHKVNRDALITTIQFAKMLKCKIFNDIHFMRKTVVNGSNTSGFQRTSFVATNGDLDGISIEGVFLEEDAAKIIGKEQDYTVYRLDRLGIPLIEVATGPDIKTPEQAKEVAEKIGMIFRSTGKAKRGLGTIRQDLNISVTGGSRIEIKGAQDIKIVPLLIENEAKRQINLIRLEENLVGVKEADYEKSIIDVSEIFKNTECKFVNAGLKKKNSLTAIKIDKFKGILGMELTTGFRVGSELAGYAKTRGFGGIIHSDEDLKKYKFSEEEIKNVEKQLKLKDNDAWFMLLGDKEKAIALLKELIIPRINQFFKGVPEEVRDAQPDGTSVFIRPMPGAARMYPETDVPITHISDEEIKNIKLPELITDVSERYTKMGLGKDLANLISKSEKKDLFDQCVKEFNNIKPSFIAETLIPTLKELARKEKVDTDKITDENFKELFSLLDQGKVAKNSVNDILLDICKGEGINPEKYALISDEELEKELKTIVKENKGLPFNALIGKAMAKFKGKADGKKVMELLKRLSA